MFYGSGAGKLPTASAVVADVIDMTKHTKRNVYVAWSEEKLVLDDSKNNASRFFVRTSSAHEEIEEAFGNVDYVEGVIDGETGFMTDVMTEAEFEVKATKIAIIGRIRVA